VPAGEIVERALFERRIFCGTAPSHSKAIGQARHIWAISTCVCRTKFKNTNDNLMKKLAYAEKALGR
jgi:hypothetical protein